MDRASQADKSINQVNTCVKPWKGSAEDVSCPGGPTGGNAEVTPPQPTPSGASACLPGATGGHPGRPQSQGGLGGTEASPRGEAGGKALGVQGAKPPPSLVDNGITQQSQLQNEAGRTVRSQPRTVKNEANETEVCRCQSGWYFKGVCEHGTVRWLWKPCKRRDCPVCGVHRRRMIAWRIAYGIEMLGGSSGGGWFVGTFGKDIGKREAVQVVGKFIRWLRGRLGYQVEYASTWEVMQNGRYHVNLVLAPWRYVPKKVLSSAWQRCGGGMITWIERVGAGVGVEAAKSRQKIANYCGKWEQMVKEGRGVTYSKGWPKLPDGERAARRGNITWRVLLPDYYDGDLDTVDEFEYERNLGHWAECWPGEWMWRLGEKCDCFEFEGDGGLDK